MNSYAARYSEFKRIAILLLLLILALLGNHFRLPLAFNIEFLFGSIAALTAMLLYGMRWGILISIISSMQTILAWNHPYAFIIFSLEVIFVGYLLKQAPERNVVLLDSLYWACLGMPLVGIFYGLILKVGLTPTLIIMFKQSLNGSFNALIACLVSDSILWRWSLLFSRAKPNLSLSRSLLTLLVAFLLIPGLILFASNSYNVMKQAEARILDSLNSAANTISSELNFFRVQQVSQDLEFLKAFVTSKDYRLDIKTTLLDTEDNVLLSTRDDIQPDQYFDYLASASVEKIDENSYKWIPDIKGQPQMMSWLNSLYGHRVLLNYGQPYTLILETPTAPHIRYLQRLHLGSLVLLWGLFMMAILLAYLFSKKLLQPILGLTHVTTDLPDKILMTQQEIDLSRCSVQEVDHLLVNFQMMVFALQEKFSEIHQANQEIKIAKESAELANCAKDEFLANISHELRTPLNAILGYTQILSRSEDLPPKEKDQIDIIYKCGNHLLDLINDVLSLSKIEAGKLELNPVDVHLPALLQNVVEMFKVKAKQKGIEFHYHADHRLPKGVRVDDKRLRQVLINLLGNAIKFTQQGQVDFVVDALEIQNEVVLLRFQVIDSGVGIMPGHLDRLFQAFEQVGEQRKQSEGTGLGLTISQRIVQLMGGVIEVASHPGQGSEFSFEISVPLAQTRAIRQAVLSRYQSIFGYVGRTRSILIVDDLWENRAVLVDFLYPLGFSILEAASAEEGLAKTESEVPDLVILDLAMPGVDGFEMLRRIRRSEVLHLQKVIVSSASVSSSEQEQAAAAGGNAFLPKPVDAGLLCNLIAQQLDLEWCHAENQAGASFEEELSTLEWSELDEASPGLPHVELLESLLALTQRGRVQELRQLLAELTQAETLHPKVASPLWKMAKQFDLLGLEEWLQAAIERRLRQSP